MIGLYHYIALGLFGAFVALELLLKGRDFPAVTYWEGAVHFEGSCDENPVQGNGYIELTGYAGNLPLR